MSRTLDLTEDQTQGYTVRYDAHMAQTSSLRDSLRTTMDAIHRAFESGDRSAARELGPSAERAWKRLSAEDRKFDQGLKDLLTKDQLERYRKEQEERQEHRWRGDRRPPPGAR